MDWETRALLAVQRRTGRRALRAATVLSRSATTLPPGSSWASSEPRGRLTRKDDRRVTA